MKRLITNGRYVSSTNGNILFVINPTSNCIIDGFTLSGTRIGSSSIGQASQGPPQSISSSPWFCIPSSQVAVGTGGICTHDLTSSGFVVLIILLTRLWLYKTSHLFKSQHVLYWIPVDKHELVFEPFYEVQSAIHHTTSKTKFMGGGIGLGLTLAKEVIDTHQGNIYIESDENKGSTFSIILPYVNIEEKEPVLMET